MPVTAGAREGIGRGVPAGLQMISFAIELDDDQRFKKWEWMKVPRDRSIAQIAARSGNPEDARRVAKKNKVRSVNRLLWIKLSKKQRKAKKKRKQVKKLLVPGNWGPGNAFHVLAGDNPPRVVGGYAKFETIARPERAGLLRFDGYDPIELEIPIRFEARGEAMAKELEKDMKLLEKMAGRGRFEGAAVGPPPIVGISVTGGGDGHVVPLIPRSYQRTQKSAVPLWRIAGIDWDASPLRNSDGNRTRQLATVTARQHVEVKLATRSVTKRARTKKSDKK